MKQIAILTNKTRDEKRAPLLSVRATAELLAQAGFEKPSPPLKPAESQKTLRRKGERRKPVPTGHAAVEQPAAKKQPAAQEKPVEKVQPPAQGKPATKVQPAAQEKPAAKEQPAAQEKPGAKDTPGLRPTQFQRRDFRQPVIRPFGQQNRSAAVPPAAQNGSQDKKPPEQKATPEQKVPPATPPNGHSNGQGKPFGSNLPEMKAPGMNGSTTNGNGIKAPGSNGIGKNGSEPRQTLFRPTPFSNMPALRVPPKNGTNGQKPPVQIPMEIYHPDGEPANGKQPDGRGRSPDEERMRNEARENNRPVEAEVPPTNPVPPKLRPTSSPSLEQVLKQNARLPDQSVLLGVCEDGLPVVLDLHDPTPGAVVVIGDEREAQLDILRAAVASIAKRNSPRNVQFLILSCEPRVWASWAREHGFDRYCLAIESAEEEPVREWIIRLADWTEQRRLGQTSGPAVLLIMDTLSFLPQLSFDIRLNFDWMAKEGPAAQIWPLAVISTDLAKSLSGRRMLRAFQTRVLGYASRREDYIQLAGINEQDTANFGRRGEFKVKVGEDWLCFRLPGK